MNYQIISNKSDKNVLFIHGLGGSLETWKYQIADFKDYNIIRVDLEGHGKSDWHRSKGDTVDVSSCREINAILEENNIDKVDVISLSLGTLVAFEFAYLYPDKVNTMVFGGGVLNINLGRKFLLHFVRFFRFFVPGQVMYWLFSFIILPRKNHNKSRKIFVREAMKMKSAAFWNWLTILNPTKEKLAGFYNTIKEKAINVLFISGEEDHMFVSGIKKMKQFLDNCKVKIIKKCGHIVSIEKSEAFDRLALVFLKKAHEEDVVGSTI